MPIVTDPEFGYARQAAMAQYFRGTGSNKQMGYSVRTTRYRLTKWRSFVEVYDYLTDEWEVKNLASVDVELKQALLSVLKKSTDIESVVPFDFDERLAILTKPAPNYP
jgi:hypothetical protein